MDVWMDDLRPAPEGWHWVKTAEEAIDLLENQLVEAISLDNDLGENLTEGYKVVEWMAAHNVWPALVIIHTSNTVNRLRMTRVLETSGHYGRGVMVKLDGIYDGIMYQLDLKPK